MKLLITRPYLDSIRTKRIIEERTDHKVNISPAIRIKYLKKKIGFPKNSKLIITSANALESLCRLTERRDFELYVIGESSLSKARDLGFNKIKFSEKLLENSNSHNLAKYIISDYKKDDLLIHITSKNSKALIGEKLIVNGINYKAVELYDIEPVKIKNNIAENIKSNEYDGYLFFSSLTAKHFISTLKSQKLDKYFRNIKIFCLSPSIYDVFKDYGDLKIYYPDKININSLVEILGEHNGR